MTTGPQLESFPTLFIPHGGGPCFFMEWNPPDTWKKMGAWLGSLAASIGVTPKAIVVISGHWERPEPSVTGGAHPPLIYDYQGFPPATYQLRCDAPAHPHWLSRSPSCWDRQDFRRGSMRIAASITACSFRSS